MKKIVQTPGAPAAIGPYSQGVCVSNGETLYISGQIPIDPETNQLIDSDIKTMTVRVMENIRAVLREAGMDFSSVVKTCIFLVDLKDFAAVNEVYASYFTGDFPARETAQAACLPKNARLEISVIAAKS
jgi:2-iminobutanoate/2-iminopropanoate deaminase